MGSPVRASSIATLRGRTRGSRNSPPAAAISERFTSGIPKRAAVDATMRSHDKAISVPPANAGPSHAAMRGFDRSLVTMPAKPPLAVLICRACPEATNFRSAPAQNTGPRPVRIAAQILGLDSTSSSARSIPLATSPLTALRASGRLIAMTAILPEVPWISTSTMAPTLIVGASDDQASVFGASV